MEILLYITKIDCLRPYRSLIWIGIKKLNGCAA